MYVYIYIHTYSYINDERAHVAQQIAREAHVPRENIPLNKYKTNIKLTSANAHLYTRIYINI